jgi:hypothetical protein
MIKKLLNLSLALVLTGVVFYSLTGSPGGRTGSYSGSGCQSCHLGSGGTTTLTTNIPAAGFTPGVTYACTLNVAQSGRSLFGCDLAVLAGSTKKGTLAATNTRCQVLSSEITHKNNGGAVANSCDFTFNWTAPAAIATGVTFKWSGMAANGNGGDTGDLTNVSSSTFNLAPNAAQEMAKTQFNVYPNPTTEKITLNFEETKEVQTIQVTNLEGKLMYRSLLPAGNKNWEIDVQSFTPGMYFVSFGDFTQKFQVK